jgi:hypothetical protein
VLINPSTLGSVQSLPVGEYEAVVDWVFRAMHCDGRGDAIDPINPFATSCIPPRTWLRIRFPFEVTPWHT